MQNKSLFHEFCQLFQTNWRFGKQLPSPIPVLQVTRILRKELQELLSRLFVNSYQNKIRFALPSSFGNVLELALVTHIFDDDLKFVS